MKYVGLGEKKKKDPLAPPKKKYERKEKKEKKGFTKTKGLKREGQGEWHDQEQGQGQFQGEWQGTQQGLGSGPLKKRRRLEMGVHGEGQGLGQSLTKQQQQRGPSIGTETWARSDDSDDSDDNHQHDNGIFKYGYGRGSDNNNNNNNNHDPRRSEGYGAAVGMLSSRLLGGLGKQQSTGAGGRSRRNGGRAIVKPSPVGVLSESSRQQQPMGNMMMSSCLSEECMSRSAQSGGHGSLHLLIQTASSTDPSMFDSR